MNPTLALYTYGGDPGRCLRVLLGLLAEDPQWHFRTPDGEGGIYRARSRGATEFLKLDSDVLVEQDADVTVSPADRRYLVEICRETRGVVGCMIARKAKGKGLASRLPPGSYAPGVGDRLIDLPPGYWAGAGLLASHRDVFESLGTTIKQVRQGYFPFYRPFEVELDDGGPPVDLSEDWAFVERARQAGSRIVVAEKPRVEHWGAWPYTTEDAAERMT